ncbi:MAG: FkbM family methyltransferase [Thermoplasmata archaeon]
MEARVTEEFQRSPVDIGRIGGARVHLNPRNTLAQNASMAIAGWYEPAVTEVLSSLCRPNGLVVDVGANIGWYTFLAAERVGTGGRVLGFEPDPENFHLLSTTLRENPRPQIRIHESCLSDRDGEEQLFLSEEAASYHSISRPVGVRSIPVSATRLDTVVEKEGIRSIDMVKVDVEGGEPKVLRGALTALRSGVIRSLIIEWRPESWGAEESLWNEVTAMFDVFRLVPSPRLLVALSDPTVARVSGETTVAGIHGHDLFLSWKR